MDVTKHYKFIGFGAIDVSKPYKFQVVTGVVREFLSIIRIKTRRQASSNAKLPDLTRKPNTLRNFWILGLGVPRTWAFMRPVVAPPPEASFFRKH